MKISLSFDHGKVPMFSRCGPGCKRFGVMLVYFESQDGKKKKRKEKKTELETNLVLRANNAHIIWRVTQSFFPQQCFQASDR